MITDQQPRQTIGRNDHPRCDEEHPGNCADHSRRVGAVKEI